MGYFWRKLADTFSPATLFVFVQNKQMTHHIKWLILTFSIKLISLENTVLSLINAPGVAVFQKGDVYKRQVFNAKMQCLSLFTMTRRREI